VLSEGLAAILKNNWGTAKLGQLVLTDQRLFWQERGWLWPLTKGFQSVPLTEIADVEHTGILGLVFGGRRLQTRLRSGKSFRIWVDPDGPAAWANRIRMASHGAA
jgi:hypothetical protein